MKTLNVLPIKRHSKRDREIQVLFGLVDYYLRTGKPVGSHSLQEAGFENLSSATIRNYFATLEKEGFLAQPHSSGGRIPTNAAFRLYANEQLESKAGDLQYEEAFSDIRKRESREVAAFLEDSAERLSTLTQMAVFLSAPRFDQDYVVSIKLVAIDHQRCLCVIITDFGVIRTEVVYLEQRLTVHALARIESYFHWRLTGHDKPENFTKEEEEISQKIYNEVMLRYLVSYSNFIDTELYKTGFSKLLTYPDFLDTNVLAEGLALFENAHSMRLLVKECCKHGHLKFWIGEDLSHYTTSTPNCSIIAIPYYINNHIVGAVGLLGPIRMPYSSLFSIMRCFSHIVSETLTKNLFKFKITFRQPQTRMQALEHSKNQLFLLENIS